MFARVAKRLKQLLVVMWALLLAVVIVVITLDNTEPATLHLFGHPFTASLGFLWVVALSLGILVGIACSLPALYFARKRCQRALAREAQLKAQTDTPPAA